MKNKALFLFSFLIMQCSFIHASNEIDLAYKLRKNDRFKLEVITNQNISMEMMGQQMSIMQNSTLNQEILITETSEAGYTFETTYQRIQFKQNAMGMEIFWDSDQPETNDPIVQQIAASLNKTIGSVVTTSIDKRGLPLSTNRNEVIKEGNNITGFESGMMVVYAENPVKIGESWEVELKPDPESDFVITSTYVIEKVKGKVAHIQFDGIINGTQVMGQKATINGTIQGKTKVDLQNGWIIDATINQTLDMTMEQEGMQIPMKMSSFVEMISR